MAQDNGLLVDLVHGGAANAEFIRDTSRPVDYEHTLFANALGIRTNFTPEDAGPAVGRSSPGARRARPCRPPPSTSPASPSTSASDVRVDYVWDAERRRLGPLPGRPATTAPPTARFVDEAGDPGGAAERRDPQPAVRDERRRSPVAQSVGGGSGLILTEGKARARQLAAREPRRPVDADRPDHRRPRRAARRSHLGGAARSRTSTSWCR